jgi:hypothetical protein
VRVDVLWKLGHPRQTWIMRRVSKLANQSEHGAGCDDFGDSVCGYNHEKAFR